MLILLAVDGFFLSILLKRVQSPVVLSYVVPSQSSLSLHLAQHLNKDVAKSVSISVPISSVLPMIRHGQVPSVVKIKLFNHLIMWTRCFILITRFTHFTE